MDAPLLAWARRMAVDTESIRPPDEDLVRIAVRLLRVLRYYFRPQVLGLEHLGEGPALLVANHNGGITSLEPFFLGMEWYRRHAGRDLLHFLAHDALVAAPGLGHLLTRLGVIRASFANAEHALNEGKKVVVFPGGNYEAFRPFRERHRVDFGGKTGYLRLALKTGAPLHPVLCLGGHETFFVLRRGQRLARWSGVKRWLRSDSFPIFLGLPWGLGVGPLFHFPLPAKLTVEVGPRIPLDAGDSRPGSDHLVRLGRMVEGRLQQMMAARRSAGR